MVGYVTYCNTCVYITCPLVSNSLDLAHRSHSLERYIILKRMVLILYITLNSHHTNTHTQSLIKRRNAINCYFFCVCYFLICFQLIYRTYIYKRIGKLYKYFWEGGRRVVTIRLRSPACPGHFVCQLYYIYIYGERKRERRDFFILKRLCILLTLRISSIYAFCFIYSRFFQFFPSSSSFIVTQLY